MLNLFAESCRLLSLIQVTLQLHIDGVAQNCSNCNLVLSHWYILLYKLFMECLWPDHEGGSWSTFMVPAHLSALLNSSRGIGTQTCRLDNVFPPDDLWFVSDTECELCCYVHLPLMHFYLNSLNSIFSYYSSITSWRVFRETISVSVNGILDNYSLFGLCVHFGCFLTHLVVDIQLSPWIFGNTSLRLRIISKLQRLHRWSLGMDK